MRTAQEVLVVGEEHRGHKGVTENSENNTASLSVNLCASVLILLLRLAVQDQVILSILKRQPLQRFTIVYSDDQRRLGING